MTVSSTQKRYIIYNGEFVEVQKLTFENIRYTYLGNRIETSVHIVYNGENEVLKFIQGYDTLDIFIEIDIRAKVHRFLAIKSRQESSYLMGLLFENIEFRVEGGYIHIICDSYSIDGNFGIKDFEGKVRLGVPLEVVNSSKEGIINYLRGFKVINTFLCIFFIFLFSI